MKVQIKRPCLVGGYGNTPVTAKSVVQPNTVEEAKGLIAAGLAVEVPEKMELTIQPTKLPLGAEARLTDAQGNTLSGVTSTTNAAVGTQLAGANLGQTDEEKALERYKAFVNRNAEDVIANIQALTDEQKPALPAVLEVEKAGKNRKTVVEAIEAAMTA